MKQLNWYQIFGNTHTIPDGRTVTPTDDIQIWLNCADIWDKSYTTLAEVLADTDTLLALISSNNAVDYMVRSTTWAESITVPKMTSNTSPEGECIISSQYSTYPAYLSFDRDETTRGTYTGVANGYIGYVFPTAVQCIYAEIYPQANFTGETFYIQGSDDGITWNNLSEALTNLTVEKHKVALSNNSAKRYYRLTNTTRNLSYSGYAVFTLQFCSASITADATAMTYIGQNNYCANTLLADATWCNAICNSEYFESVLNVKVPTMTSDTTPEGECFGKDKYGSQNYWSAFDGNDNTAVHSANYSSVVDWFIGYKFTQGVKIYMLTYLISQAQSQAVTFTIKNQRSADNITWTDASDTENLSIPSGGGQKISGKIVNNSIESQSYHRIYTNGKGITPATLQFYGRKDV